MPLMLANLCLYAPGSDMASCLVCHEAMADRGRSTK